MSEKVGLSMGAVVRATGIPANTLRTWERRYGFPSPDRTDGGHRIYSPEVIPRLRLVSRALDDGHRAAQVVPTSTADLRRLLGVASPAPAPEGAGSLLSAVLDLDGPALQSALRGGVAAMGLQRFLQDRLSPFLVDVGERWANGELSIFQEHFASDHVRSFLADTWRNLGSNGEGPVAVLATLSGERHELGLHMAASVMALRGWSIVCLGSDTPAPEVASACERSKAASVVVSFALGADPDLARDQLEELRSDLRGEVSLIVGGVGAPEDVDGVIKVTSLDDLASWAGGSVA